MTMQPLAMEGEMQFQDTIEFSSACSATKLSQVIEKRNLIAENNSRPANVYLPSWESIHSVALDIMLTFSLPPNVYSHAAEKTGYANENAEDRRYAQYEDACAQ